MALSSDRRHLLAEDVDGFEGEPDGAGRLVGPRSPANLERLRQLLPWLRPRPLGLATSAGLGDRLGLATPGHALALRQSGRGVAPVFAQQSIREMERTLRSPRQVLDDAAWGVFEAGWRDPWGADADHLKAPAAVADCAAAGYTLFTFDPGEHVEPLATTPAAKYGAAVEHVAQLHRELRRAAPGQFEVEVSVDETESPTTPAEHAYVARELRRAGVEFVSLAPRYPGRFEKGVDYIGDLADLEADLAGHAAVMAELGPYKLSLHSGSDKFAAYPAFSRQAGRLFHLKTAGTSYLEALRTAGDLDPRLLEEIYVLALERYPQDRASYHVSADPARAPAPGSPGLLDDFHARQVLHVTFGSVLARHGGRLRALLEANAGAYQRQLARHLGRHLAPFAA